MSLTEVSTNSFFLCVCTCLNCFKWNIKLQFHVVYCFWQLKHHQLAGLGNIFSVRISFLYCSCRRLSSICLQHTSLFWQACHIDDCITQTWQSCMWVSPDVLSKGASSHLHQPSSAPSNIRAQMILTRSMHRCSLAFFLNLICIFAFNLFF